VPISAILFGGRRANTVPLVTEAFGWQHGTFLGSIMASEKTAAAAGRVGVVRRDPMAMLPFCGYHMGDYFAHWLGVGQKGGAEGRGEWGSVPRIFFVNWFRKSAKGEFLWPGFGENSRVLKWVFERCQGDGPTIESPIGLHPTADGLDLDGLDISKADLAELFKVDMADWHREVTLLHDHYAQFGDRLPEALKAELHSLEETVKSHHD
jgi:phosphoenolpyruvate carboxykinase (GTP)